MVIGYAITEVHCLGKCLLILNEFCARVSAVPFLCFENASYQLTRIVYSSCLLADQFFHVITTHQIISNRLLRFIFYHFEFKVLCHFPF